MLEYDFVIYPRKLWIGTEQECTEKFLDRDGDEIEFDDDWDALTVPVMHKETNDLGWFVVLKERAKASIMGHEAAHVAMFVCKDIDIDIDIDNQEPFAYLVGFICKCIANYEAN